MAFTKCNPGMGSKPRFKRVERDDDIECPLCGSFFPRARREVFGIDSCLACSTEVPKHANVPMHKQAYGYSHTSDAVRENCYSTHK